MNLTKIALNLSIVLSLSISASWACLSKPIDPNKIRTIAPTISRQNLQALYPSVQSIDTKLRTAPQHLTQKLGHEALNANSLNKVQEESARTIFHALNDTLNLLLTHHDLIKSAMPSNMSVLRGTSLVMISNEDEIQVIPKLSILQHDVADVVNALHLLNDLQKNIDVVAYIKQTIFHQNSVHFYQHNDASFMAPLVEDMMNRLEVMCAHKKERPTLISDPDTLLFIQMKDSYIDSLLSAFQTIHRVLPKGTITKVVLTSNSLNQRGKALKKIKAEISDNEGKAKKERKLIEQFFGRHRNIDMLLNLTSDVVMLGVPIDGDDSLPAMIKNSLAKKFEDMDDIPSLESLFGAIDLNIKLLAQERKTMGIRDGDFKYFLRARESLEHALAEWERKHKPIIMDSVPAPAAPVLDAQAPKAEVVDSQQGVDVPKKMLTEPKNHATTPEAVTTIDAPHNTLMNDSSSDHDQGMDAFVYTSEYFQKEHSYHQQRKKSASPSSTQHQLSTYETDLYTLLKDRIYRPAGHRPTWAELVDGLAHLGFKGSPNTNGNGSTWVFSVTEKNKLFYDNDAYKGATFNVHKYPVDNEPMNLSYLTFFKSGLTNVFGLSEEYVMEQLSRDTSNLKTGVIVKI